jgi:hypothetical protein
MREWRKENRLNAEQRRKANSRRHARVYQERGKLVPRPCEVCGGAAEKHHVDYDQPLNVRWLCRPHHLDHHRQEAPAATSDGLDRLEATLTSLGM